VKILHVSPYSDAAFGGPVSTLSGLAKAQRIAGDDVTVLTMTHARSTSSIIEPLRAAGVDVVTAGTGRGPVLSSREIRSAVRIIPSFDVVHVHGVWEDLLVASLGAAGRAGVTSVVRPCGMLTSWSLSQHAWRKRILWRTRVRAAYATAKAVHFASDQEQRETSIVPLAGQAFFIEPNGIDAGSVTGGDGARFRARRQLPPEDRVVLFIGRVHPGKGIERLIRATQSLPPDAVTVIAGPGEGAYEDSLRGLVLSCNVQDRVRFTGALDPEMRRDALAAARIFALVSDHESFGNSALEAMAAGVPCVVTDRVPLAREIASYDCGEVCSRDDAAVAASLNRLLDRVGIDPAIRDRARECALEYDWTRVVPRIRREYEALRSLPAADPA
jgi:glycosyltransferase involved in cell wall biosynthesis